MMKVREEPSKPEVASRRLCIVGRDRHLSGEWVASFATALGAREEFELDKVISCCSGERRRRTELDFGSRKPLDDLHRTTALGTAPKTKRGFNISNVLFDLRVWGGAEMVKAKR